MLFRDMPDETLYEFNRKVQDNLREGLPYPYTEQNGTDFISVMLSADENETFAFAITADGRVVGSIGVFHQGNIHRRTAELGYYIAEGYWGKGIMTEAVKQVCGYVFEKSNIIRIYAEPFAYNTASCRVPEKAGFQCEGTLRKNAVKNGKVIDMKIYSLYAVCKCADEIEAFRYRFLDGKVVLFEHIDTAFTYLNQDTGLFKVVNVPLRGSIQEYVETAGRIAREQLWMGYILDSLWIGSRNIWNHFRSEG